MVSVIDLLVSAALPVVNVFLMCLVGYALTKKGVIDARGRQTLSQLIFWIFVPALIFTKLAGSVNLSNLKIWWILPVNMVISISLGLVIGYLFSKLLRVDGWFRKHFMCAVALGNVGNLPIVLVQSICSNKQTLFAQALPNGTCEQKGLAYVAFSMWVASTFQYCIAFNMLKKPEEERVHDESSDPIKSTAHPRAEDEHTNGDLQMTTFNKSTVFSDRSRKESSGHGFDEQKEIEVHIHAGPNEAMHSDLEAVGEHPQESTSSRPTGDLESEQLIGRSGGDRSSNGREGLAFGRQRGTHMWALSPEGAQLRRKKQKEIQRWLKGIPWGSYLNMPTMAALAGLSVGCVSAVKMLLFGDSPPLLCLTQSLEIMAGGMIPCMMLILGSSLAQGPGRARLDARVILGCLLVRLIIMPAIGTGIVVAMLKAGIFTAPDPLFLFVLLLCHAPPTAMNLQTVATLNENGEEEMSTLLCWQYPAALVTIPLWMLLFVAITSP